MPSDIKNVFYITVTRKNAEHIIIVVFFQCWCLNVHRNCFEYKGETLRQFFSVFLNLLTTHFYERARGMRRNALWTRLEADFYEALYKQNTVNFLKNIYISTFHLGINLFL